MAKSNTQKVLSLIFLPAVLLLVLLAGSSNLFLLAQNILIGKLIEDVSQIPALKSLIIFPQIILALALLIVSYYQSFEKVFRGTLIVFIGMTSLLTVLVFFQEHLQLQGISATLENLMPSHMVQLYEPLMRKWPLSLLYLILNLLNLTLFSLLIWGFINRLMTLSEGIKYDIPFAFVLGLLGVLITNLGLLTGFSESSLLFTELPDGLLISIMIPAIVLLTFALMIFNWAWKRLPDNLLHPEELLITPKSRFPFLAGAYLLAGAVMIETLLTEIFKSQARMQFPDARNYSNFMSDYSTFAGLFTITISILWAIVGTWLILKQGWRIAILCGSLSTLIGGLAFLGYSIASQSVSWLGQGMVIGLLKGTTSVLFFPLIQIIYLYMPYQSRFIIKVITEMIALPLMKSIPSLVTIGLLAVVPLSAISIYLKILIPILLVLLVLASWRISSRFADGFPNDSSQSDRSLA